MSHHWKHLPYLEALRPETGYQVDAAILTSYSADLSVIMAALLALSARDNDRGSGGKVDVATALENLRGKVRVLMQAGRLSAPPARPAILAVLDNYVRQVTFAESQSSWHPKLALVRYVNAAGQKTYRLWFGSKNLTRDSSWDAGILIVSSSGSGGVEIPDVLGLAQDLAVRAELPGWDARTLGRELNGLKWQLPAGISLQALELRLPGSGDFPPAPRNVSRLLLVSPFLDEAAIRHFRAWGQEGTERVLLSTHPELFRLQNRAPGIFEGFRCLAMETPEPEATAPGVAEGEGTGAPADDPEGEEALPCGLHAKLVLANHNTTRTLWLGSANCTSRGWNGGNAEIMARLQVKEDVSRGLEEFLEGATTVSFESGVIVVPEDQDAEILMRLRQQLAAFWDLKQLAQNANHGPILVSNPPQPKWDEQIQLSVGLFGCPAVAWPVGALRVELPRILPHQETELVEITLRLGGVSCSWLQHASLVTPPGEDRDKAALAHFLGPRAFLQWIRSLLTEDVAAEPDDWDKSPSARYHTAEDNREEYVRLAPSLEEILKSWSRNEGSLRAVDRQVNRYLRLVKTNKVPAEKAELEELAEFEKVWRIISRQLLA